MAIKKSRELYSFNIDVERETVKMVEIEREVEVEKEVEKQRKR